VEEKEKWGGVGKGGRKTSERDGGGDSDTHFLATSITVLSSFSPCFPHPFRFSIIFSRRVKRSFTSVPCTRNKKAKGEGGGGVYIGEDGSDEEETATDIRCHILDIYLEPGR